MLVRGVRAAVTAAALVATAAVGVAAAPQADASSPPTFATVVGSDVALPFNARTGAAAIDPNVGQIYVTPYPTGQYPTQIEELLYGRYSGVNTLTVGNTPTGLAVDPANSNLYVTNSQDDTLTIDDRFIGAGMWDLQLPAGSGPRAAAIDPQRHRLYVADQNSGQVTVVDTVTQQIVTSVPAGSEPWAVTVDPDTGEVYVMDLGGSKDTVDVLDPDTLQVIATVTVGTSPVSAAVDPASDTVFVTNELSNTVSAIDGATHTVTATIPVGTNPAAITEDTATRYLYVANNDSDSVSVIDATTRTVTATVAPVVPYPSAVLVDPATNVAYVVGAGAVQQIRMTPGQQSINVTSTPPASPVVGDQSTVAATGGPSGQPLTFSSATPDTCTVESTTVTYVAAGTCTVDADQAGNARYAAAATVQQTVAVGKAAQTVTFTSLPPNDPPNGTSYQPTATGGASGQPVTFSIATPDICTTARGTVSFTAVGQCVLHADQAGNANYTAAPTASQQITVSPAPTHVNVTVSTAVSGQPVTGAATVTATEPAGAVGPAGTVQFILNGAAFGDPVPVAANGVARSATFARAAGNYTLAAEFTPTSANYAPATADTAFVVDPATTATQLSISRTALRATVTPVAPGTGTPSGSVTFSVDGKRVGTATLSGNAATLPFTVATGATRHVSAVYGGDGSYLQSSTSTSRSDPTIAARVSSSAPKSRSGWYRTPVTVTFTCRTAGAPLTAACPEPVTLTRSAAAQSVARTITATNGGADTVSVHVNLDRQPPTVTVQGVRSGHTYQSAPHLTCHARDALSGVASCAVHTHRNGRTVHYTAVGTDRAGNQRTKSGIYYLRASGSRTADTRQVDARRSPAAGEVRLVRRTWLG